MFKAKEKNRIWITLMITAVCLCGLLMNCTNQKKNNEFTLHINFKGENAKYLILVYKDSSNSRVIDTFKVKGSEYKTNGYIKGATRVGIFNDLRNIEDIEDPNTFSFFIEPKNNYVNLVENKFKEAIVKGSKTQKEDEKLLKSVDDVYSDINILMRKRKDLIKKKYEGGNVELINGQIEEISLKQKNNLKKIKNVYFDFIESNPNSDLSAYWLNFYFNETQKDSLELYFSKFTPEVKNNLYGNQIEEKIRAINSSISSNIGDIAYNFDLIDINDKKINLGQFKGKYVLLDFWASWCAPCRKANPKLKRLYIEYHPKGLEVVGLSSDRDKALWKGAVKKDGIDIWHQVYSGNNVLFNSTNYNFKAIPAYILINKEGYIIGRYLSASTEGKDFNDLEYKLAEIFLK